MSMEDQDGFVAAQMPLWQSHKKVRADRIVRIEPVGDGDEWLGIEDTGTRFVLECGIVAAAMMPLVARGWPSVGDYLVRYEDGYTSWSPAAPFEDGYTRLG